MSKTVQLGGFVLLLLHWELVNSRVEVSRVFWTGKKFSFKVCRKKCPHAQISGARNAPLAVKIQGDSYITGVQRGDLAKPWTSGDFDALRFGCPVNHSFTGGVQGKVVSLCNAVLVWRGLRIPELYRRNRDQSLFLLLCFLHVNLEMFPMGGHYV